VRRGVDPAKDQSYQLFGVAEENLARTRLPIGDLKKSQVRELARHAGLKTAEKKDSQEICFVPGNDYRRLLDEKGVPRHAGDLVDTSGLKIGEHEGTENFTIGQRRGHGIGGGDPLFVVALEPESGRVVLGAREECTVRSMRVSDLNWIGFDVPASGELRCEVQHRYHCDPASATVFVDSSSEKGRGGADVVFDEPQMAVTPGQGAAFYRGDLLLGGGWIESTPRSRLAPEVACEQHAS
jgi:tRNA-specific 2-thiouridylase